jgi:hypothetical protein
MSKLKDQSKVPVHEKPRDEDGKPVKGKPYLKTQPKAERFVPKDGRAKAKGAETPEQEKAGATESVEESESVE